MTADMIRSLFAYQMQEDRCLWDAIMTLPEPAFKVDTGYSLGSLQAECAHVVDAMHRSLKRVHCAESTSPVVTIGRTYARANQGEYGTWSKQNGSLTFSRLMKTLSGARSNSFIAKRR